jgi:hypothetical protein
MTVLSVTHPVRDGSSVEVEIEFRARLPHAVRYATKKGQRSIPDGMRYCSGTFVSTELQSLWDFSTNYLFDIIYFTFLT